MHFDVFHVLEPRTGVQGPVQVTQTLQALESGTMACDAAGILNLLGLWLVTGLIMLITDPA